MGFTTAGLANGGRTTHYQFSFDDTFAAADGPVRTQQAMDECENDFNLMQSWFSGVSFQFSFPINVQIANATGGASWTDPPNIVLPFGYNPTVTINSGTGTSSGFIRYLLVSEVTEMFMASQNKGWYESTSLVSGADEGSKGEGLSRFLGRQFQLARGINQRFAGFEVVHLWLNSARPNKVDMNPDDIQPDIVNGCTTCFIYYLHNQLGFSIEAIIAAAGSTLADVYKNLTGKSDAWTSFIGLVNTFYPPPPPNMPNFTYNPTSDAIFPVAHLWNLDNAQILSGASMNDRILALDNTALAEVVVSLSSDNPSILSISQQVTLEPGTWATGVDLSAAPITGPLQTVGIHATYAGKTLNAAVQILPRPSVLEGHVRNTAFAPVADATLFLSANAPITPTTGNTLQLSTDANGFYQTPTITPQFYQVTASRSDYVPKQQSVTVNEGVPFTTLDFILVTPEAYIVKGTVSVLGGGPLAGAEVTLGINSPVPGFLHAITDANGAYSIIGNPGSYTGDYTLTASLAGYMSSSVTFSIPNGATVIQNLMLAPLGSLSGTVRDTMGKPIANATVTAGTASALSDANGAYSLAGIDPGPTEVDASALGYDPTQLQIMIGAGAHVVQDIALTPASATITGTVTSADVDSLPISGASVLLIGTGTTHTDGDGGYTFSNVPAGDHTVQASAKLYKPQSASVHVIAHQTVEQDFILASVRPPPPPRGPSGQPM